MTDALKYRLKISYSEDTESPNEWDGWKVKSFNNRHSNHIDPYSILSESVNPKTNLPDFTNTELQEKYEKGLLFFLSYYEHGNCIWSLINELPLGANCPFDSVRIMGIVVWEEDEDNLGENKSIEYRKESARSFVETYTQWCNGEIYGYQLSTIKECPHCGQETEDEIDSCWGFYDKESMIDNFIGYIPKGTEVEIVGNCDFFLDQSDLEKEWKKTDAKQSS